MKTKKLTAFLLLLFLGGLVQAQNSPANNNDLVTAGMNAPAFRYEAEKGKTVKSAELKGKVVLINFFAT